MLENIECSLKYIERIKDMDVENVDTSLSFNNDISNKNISDDMIYIDNIDIHDMSLYCKMVIILFIKEKDQ